MKLENICCNLCSSENTVLLFSKPDELTNEETIFSVVKCVDCGLVYVNPRPSVEDIHIFYPKEFLSYQFEVNNSVDTSIRERVVSFIVQSSAKQRVQSIKKLLDIHKDMNVLDVGCGKGGFLLELQKEVGCQVTGIDFDKNSVDFCREKLGLDVHCGGVDRLDSMTEKYDLVTMWHFFEHEYDPLTALKRINRRLDVGKYLLIEVPNADSLENRLFGQHSFLYDVPRHLYDFSPTTITKYLEKTGFKLEGMRFPYFSGGWLGSVQSKFFKNKIYSDLKGNVFLFFILSLLVAPLDILLSMTNRGSIMTLVAKKVEDI